MAVRKAKLRLHHFKIPCWFSFVDSPKNFENVKNFLLEDLKENGFKHFREEKVEIHEDDIRDESKFWDIPNSNWT